MNMALVILCWVLGVGAYLFVGGKVAKYNLQLQDWGISPGLLVIAWPLWVVLIAVANVWSFILYLVVR